MWQFHLGLVKGLPFFGSMDVSLSPVWSKANKIDIPPTRCISMSFEGETGVIEFT